MYVGRNIVLLLLLLCSSSFAAEEPGVGLPCIDQNIPCENEYEQFLKDKLNKRGFFQSQITRRRSYPYLDKSFSYYEEGNFNHAIQELDKYLQVDPYHDLIRWYQLVMISMLDQYDETINAATKFIQLAESPGPALLVRANAYRQAGEIALAAGDYEQALNTEQHGYSRRRDILQSLFNLAYQQNENEKALKWLHELSLIDGETTEILTARANLFTSLGQDDEAIKQWSQILRETDTEIIKLQALLSLAHLQVKRDEHDIAIDYFTRALVIEDSVTTRINAAESAWRLDQYQTVQVMLEPVINNQLYQKNNEYGLRQRYCQTFDKLGQFDVASNCVSELITLYPEQTDLLRYGSDLAFRSGDQDTYLVWLKDLYSDSPDAKTASMIAYLLNKTNQHTEAESWHARSSRLSQSPEYAIAYADNLLINDKSEQASVVYHQVAGNQRSSRRQQAYAYASLADIHLRNAEYGYADKMWIRAYELSANPLYILRRVITQLKAKNIDQAYELILPYGASLPPELDSEYHLQWYTAAADIYAQKNEHSKSQALYTMIEQNYLDELNDPTLVLSYAAAESKTGNHEKAIDLFDSVVTNQQSSKSQLIYAHASMANLYMQDKQYEQAEATWRKVHEITEDPVYLLRRVNANNLAGNDEIAYQLISTHGTSVPQNLALEHHSDWYAAAGDIYYRHKEFKKSQRIYEQLVATSPVAEYFLLLAEAARENQDIVVADQAYLQARKLGVMDNYYLKQRGYMHLRAGNISTAVTLLKQVGQDDALIQEELGYLALKQYENKEAAGYFRSTVDLLNQPNQMIDPEDSDEHKIENLGQLINSLEKNWSFSIYDGLCLGSDACEAGSEGLISPFAQGFGQAELAYHPGNYAYRDGKQLQLYSRLLWQNEKDSLKVESESIQPTLGLRYKPFKTQNFWTSLEYLFESGENTEDHVLLRTAWSMTQGNDWHIPDNKLFHGIGIAHYANLYVDAGKLLMNDDPFLIYSEGRLGKTAVLNQNTLLSGFGYLRGSFEFDDEDLRIIDIGLGLECRFRHAYDPYRGYRSEWSMILKLGEEIENNQVDKDFRANLGINLRF